MGALENSKINAWLDLCMEGNVGKRIESFSHVFTSIGAESSLAIYSGILITDIYYERLFKTMCLKRNKEVNTGHQ